MSSKAEESINFSKIQKLKLKIKIPLFFRNLNPDFLKTSKSGFSVPDLSTWHWHFLLGQQLRKVQQISQFSITPLLFYSSFVMILHYFTFLVSQKTGISLHHPLTPPKNSMNRS